MKKSLHLFVFSLTFILSASSFAWEASNEVDEYMMSPLNRYMKREQYYNFQHGIMVSASKPKSKILEGQLITINTADEEGCQAARERLKIDEDICQYDPELPLVSLVVLRDTDQVYFEKQIPLAKLPEKTKIALNSLRDFGAMGGAAFGLIYSMPESVSKWDKSRGFTALANQWSDRVAAGPVWDHDNWAINYIGHPVTGAAYYTMVRHQGFSRMESFAFSVAMSTFFWEYGVEAFAEIPSIQDLIFTPLVGSLIGELFYIWENKISANHGELLGSHALGTTATVLMNPAGVMAEKINKIFKCKFIKSTEFSLTNRNATLSTPKGTVSAESADYRYLGLQLKVIFQ